MKALASNCLLLVLLLAAAPRCGGQTVRLMTYNLRLDVASDSADAWPNRRDFVVGLIRFHAPDIFGVQEGLPHQIDFLQKNLPGYGSEGTGREGGGRGESTHVFFDRSRFSLTEAHTFWLSPTPDSVSMGWDAACLRVCTAVLLKEKGSKRRFWVFNTHLDHVGETARRNGIDLILKKMAALNPQKLPVILMGDLNSEPGSAVVSRLKNEMLDTREASEQPPFGPSGTFNGFRFGESVMKLIDYIFVSRSPRVLVKKHAVLSDSKDLHYPSDHLPVFAEIQFLKK